MSGYLSSTEMATVVKKMRNCPVCDSAPTIESSHPLSKTHIAHCGSYECSFMAYGLSIEDVVRNWNESFIQRGRCPVDPLQGEVWRMVDRITVSESEIEGMQVAIITEHHLDGSSSSIKVLPSEVEDLLEKIKRKR